MTARRVLTPEEEWEKYLPRVLRAVGNRTVAWNPEVGVSGGFQWANGRRIEDPPLLITLWKAQSHGLIRVDNEAVLLTNR